jgi:hypothetical protein
MLGPEFATIVGDRLLLENTPVETRLQLWSWLSWPARIGRALVEMGGIFALGMVVRALSQGGIRNFAGVILASLYRGRHSLSGRQRPPRPCERR